jgi:hypothetical protein
MEIKGDNRVTVVDVKMPFWSMVVCTVKRAVVSITALIMPTVLGGVGGLRSTPPCPLCCIRVDTHKRDYHPDMAYPTDPWLASCPGPS